MRTPVERLRDILEAIARIERYAGLGKRAFLQNELIQVWIIHHLQLIGEAAARLGQAFHAAYPQIPWTQIVAMRNILVHEYFGIDLEEVWTTVERDLPLLKAQITAILKELGAP